MSERNEVGRGRPPIGRQFGHGQRRAQGRPKGARGEKAIAHDIAREIHRFQRNGREEQITTYELLLMTMRDLAMEGNLRAVKWLDDCRARLNPNGEEGSLLLVPEVMEPEAWIRRTMFENRFKTNPELWDDPLLRSVTPREQ
ncbi:hypothetical protein ACVIGA_004703 [Bradyrhizobium sp. USDA 3240]|uniref:DUF5681 domain-containing protein n=1 Tax=Bradyrhizobium sp. 2S1 TaxID=1404429 RepID=UPI001CD16A0F